jgi:hypothetical protein
MTELKCPICGSKMSVCFLDGEELFSCSNLTCKAGDFYATDNTWQEFIRTYKALKIAVNAIETIKYSKKSDAINLRHKANKALIDIYKIKDRTALEQKDIK